MDSYVQNGIRYVQFDTEDIKEACRYYVETKMISNVYPNANTCSIYFDDESGCLAAVVRSHHK